MSSLHIALRTALGLLFMSHALAHAVLPMRGALEYPPPSFASALTVTAYGIAVVALFATGLGVIGSRLFAKHLVGLAGIGLASSAVALSLARDPSVWWGLSLDAVLAGALSACRNTGVISERKMMLTIKDCAESTTRIAGVRR